MAIREEISRRPETPEEPASETPEVPAPPTATPADPLWAAFGDGTPVEVGGNAPLLLVEPEVIWLVERGPVHVSVVPLDGDRPAGTRTYLFDADRGDLVLSTDRRPGTTSSAFGLIMAGVPGSRVRRLTQRRFDELSADPTTAGEIEARLRDWVDRIGASVRLALPPQQYERLQPATDSVLPAGAHGRPQLDLVWVRQRAGGGAVWGRERIRLPEGGGWFPLTGESWVTATDELTLSVTDTAGVTAEGGHWPALRAFHAAALESARLTAESTAASESDRLQRKVESDRRALGQAFSELVRGFDDAEPPPLVLDDPRDALLVACKIVAEASGIEIRTPPRSTSQTGRDELSAIANASRIRTRTVALRGRWWEDESVPTLGYLIDGDIPVALIPVKGSYVLVDPRDGGRTPVTPAVADTLTGFGHVFYRPLPEERLGPRDLLRFGLRGSRADLSTVLLMGLLGGALSLLTPIATGALFDRIIPSAQRSQLLLIALALVVSAISSALFQLTLGLGLLRLEVKMGTATQAAVWDRLLNLPPPFFHRYSAGDLQLRAMGIDAIRQILGGVVVTSILAGVFSLFSFALLFYYSVRLAVLASAMVLLVIGITLGLNLLMLRHQRQILETQGSLNGMVVQFITGISKLRVAAAENRAFLVWAQAFARQTDATSKVRLTTVHLTALQSVTPVLTTMAIFAIIAAGIEGLTPGTFLAFNSAFGQFLAAMLGLSGIFVSLLQIVPVLERAKPILESEPEVSAAKIDPGTLSGEIEINGLSFRYHDDGPLILDDVSIRIHAGEFVALVGPSGSGKSTVLRLLMGFESPTSGTIYYDQQDLADLDVRAIRRQLGVVLQHSQLMPGDVQTNILGNSGYSVDEAWEAARMAGLDDDIREMPMGMFTVVSEGMSTLSGGQRQRLMIARALVTRPRIVFFDEATSALDNHTQAAVSESIGALQATRVVIAHRLSTIRRADRIYVIQAGRIVQTGTYDELVAVEGAFLDLARRQLA